MKKLRLASIVIFVFTIVTPIIVMTTLMLIDDVFEMYLAAQYLWVMLVFIFVPIGSMIFGIVFLKNGEKTKKNIIAGSIVLTYMLIMGISSFAYEISDGKKYVEYCTSYTEVVFPKLIKAITAKQYSGSYTIVKILNNDDNNIFFNSLDNKKWQKKMTAICKGTLPISIQNKLEMYDYSMFYIPKINTYNPEYIETGKYEIILACYNESQSKILIFCSSEIVI